MKETIVEINKTKSWFFEKINKIDITRWSTLKSDLLYSLQPKMKKLYIVSKDNTGS